MKPQRPEFSQGLNLSSMTRIAVVQVHIVSQLLNSLPINNIYEATKSFSQISPLSIRHIQVPRLPARHGRATTRQLLPHAGRRHRRPALVLHQRRRLWARLLRRLPGTCRDLGALVNGHSQHRLANLDFLFFFSYRRLFIETKHD